MIGALIAYLSMDISFKLIAAGVVDFSASVVAATNATPIVVTLDADLPQGLGLIPFHGVLDGALGNTAANGIWEFAPVANQPRQVTLTSYTPQGARVGSTGNGAWTSGGRLRVALPAGRALLGRRHCFENAAPPRIVFVPFGAVRFSFDPYGGIIPPSPIPNAQASETDEQQSMLLARQVATERQRFEIHVWGAATPPDPDFLDYDVTQALYAQVVRTLFDLCPGMNIVGGSWASQSPQGAQMTTRGHEYILLAEIDQPVVDTSLLFVNPGTTGTVVVNFAGGSDSDAQTITVTS